MDLSLIVIKKGVVFLAILWLVLGLSPSTWAGNNLPAAGEQENKIAQNSPGKILPARNASPARSDAAFSGEPIEAGGPGRIDEKAAFAVREENITREIECLKWPEKFWIFLFGVYLFLLVFNLSFGWKNKKKVQWFWELLLTLLALWIWKKLDVCEIQRWFFYCVLESGLIIYGFYLHSFLTPDKKEE